MKKITRINKILTNHLKTNMQQIIRDRALDLELNPLVPVSLVSLQAVPAFLEAF